MRILASLFVFLGFAGICLYGVLFVQSSTLPPDTEAESGFAFTDPMMRQCAFYSIGLILIHVISRVPYRRWVNYSLPFFAANVALLGLVLVFGKVAGGARSWFALGAINYQPAETMKIAWVMYLADYLRYRNSYRTLSGLAVPFLITAIPLLLMLMQPDLGTAFIFVPSLFAILYLAGARKRHLLLIILAMALFAAPMYRYGLKDYQKARILAFLNPAKYEQTYSYQLRHSLLAVGGGYWMGKGLGRGEVNRMSLLPDKHTDFIFSVVAEELGFVGALGLILCYAMLFAAFMLVCHFTREPYGKNLAMCICVIMAMQTFLNIGVALGLMPTTGITLPLVSAGGSSVITCSIMVGLVLSVSRHHVTVLSGDDFLV